MMRGVLTAPVVGILLWVIISMSANSAASIKVCNSDSDCGPGNFCSNERIPPYCTPCLDCQQLLSRMNTGNCSRASQDCGPCVPGFVPRSDDENCVEEDDGELSQKVQGTGTVGSIGSKPSETSPDDEDNVSSTIFVVLGIFAAAGLCFACMLVGRRFLLKRRRRPEVNDGPRTDGYFSDEEIPPIRSRRTSPLFPSPISTSNPTSAVPRPPGFAITASPHNHRPDENARRISYGWSGDVFQPLQDRRQRADDNLQQMAPTSVHSGYVRLDYDDRIPVAERDDFIPFLDRRMPTRPDVNPQAAVAAFSLARLEPRGAPVLSIRTLRSDPLSEESIHLDVLGNPVEPENNSVHEEPMDIVDIDPDEFLVGFNPRVSPPPENYNEEAFDDSGFGSSSNNDSQEHLRQVPDMDNAQATRPYTQGSRPNYAGASEIIQLSRQSDSEDSDSNLLVSEDSFALQSFPDLSSFS